MACLIKRKNNIITEVYLPDGKTVAKSYYTILEAIEKNGIPDEHGGNVNISLSEKYLGKYIKNMTDPSELALGIYLTMYSPKFQTWYGQWSVEPTINSDFTITKDGVSRSIFDFLEHTHTLETTLASRRTKSIKGLLPAVKLMREELRDRIKQHIDARERARHNANYTKEQKIEREKYYNTLIKRLDNQIDVLQKENNIKAVIAQGVSDIQTIREMLSGSIVSLSELLLADDIVKTWANVERIFNIPNVMEVPADADGSFTTRDLLIQISNDANSFNNSIAYHAKKEIINTYNKNIADPSKEMSIKDIEAIRDISAWKKNARDITTVDNKLVGYLAKLITKVNLRIEKEHNRNHRLIDAALKKIADNPLFKEKGFDLFIKEQETRDSLGGPIKTLGFKGRFSQEWYEAVKKRYKLLAENLDKAGDNKETVALVWADHNQWIKNNTIAFDSSAFINTKAYTDADRLAIIDSLKAQGFSEEEINDFIKQARSRYQQYLADAETFGISLQDDIIKGTVVLTESDGTEEEYIKAKVEEWKKINDPIAYNNLINGTLKFSKTNVSKGSKYSIKIPRKVSGEGAITNYYDQDFAKIANDKELYEFYVFFRDFIKEQLSYLPQDEIDSLQSNFLPVVTERLSKEYGLTGLKEGIKGIGDWFFKNLTTLDYKTAGRLDPITGTKRYSFNPKFINENVAVEERTKDLGLIAKLFSDMALVYKHKIEVQDTVDTINQLVQTATKSTENIRLKGDTVVSKAPVNTQAMVQSTILRAFYGITPEAEVMSDRRFYNSLELLTFGAYKSEKYKRAKQLEEEIEAQTKRLEDPKLTSKDRKAIELDIMNKSDEYYALGGRNVSASSLLDSVNRFTREKGIALNPFSALRNLLVGGINNQIHAYGGEDFTSGQLGKATSIIKASVAKYISWGTADSETAEKILRMMLDTKTIDGEDNVFAGSLANLNGKTALDVIKKIIPSPFGLMKSTDYFFRSQTAVSMLLNKKVKTTQGEFSLFEILNKDLELDTEKFGEWDLEGNGGLLLEEVYDDMMMKINQISKKLHGFSGNVQNLPGKDTILGRMLFVFRSWLPETLAARFENKRYDPILERDTEGYYKTFFSRFVNKDGVRIKEAITEILGVLAKGQAEGLTKSEAANIRKMIMELGAIITLTLAYMALTMLVGDDDDEDAKYANIVLNQLTLLNRDLTYYINPFSFSELLQNSVPLTATLNQTADAITAASYYLARVEKKDQDGVLEYDGERTLLKLSKSLPYVNNINRVIYYSGRMGSVR